jgi:radical SAM protein with 4Fe4S-binding SPASM domain
MCFRNFEGLRTGDMSFENFKCIIDNEFPYWHSIMLQGAGEPFLNEDVFHMIAYEKRMGNYVSTFTNATLLDTGTCKRIINSGLDSLRFSLDGATADTFERLRGGADFERVVANIKNFITIMREARGSVKKPKLSITVVAMEENIHEIPDIVSLAAELGINFLEVQAYQQPMNIESTNIHFPNRALAKHCLERAVARGKKIGVKVQIPQSMYQAGAELEDTPVRRNCVSPWVQVYITHDGYVTPCCRNFTSQHYTCGNIFQEPLRRIWNNDKYQKFRTQLRSLRVPTICVNCTAL